MNETEMLFGDQAKVIDESIKAELPPNWKCKALEEEIRLIENPLLSTFAQRMIAKLPDYFFKVPSRELKSSFMRFRSMVWPVL